VDLSVYRRQHPRFAEQLGRLLPSLQVLAELARAPAPSLPAELPGHSPGQGETGLLGDFRLLREVGRGGMGVVYEAEQLSLGRRVALKVLPFAAALDPRHLQRFRTEAQAAAQLHHTHIVPVYAVGCERGVHYYAMQFIDGRSLAEVIGVRRPQGEASAGEPLTAALQESAHTPDPDPNKELVASDPDATEPYVPAAAPVARTPTAGLGSDTPVDDPSFFRAAAHLGVQAALALEYAHEQGVVHRDIKPANLLVDDRGHLWITDFGLARIQGDTQLTFTGDILGTLRYMSPEQALGKRGVDHRTDLYSLGVTLYELLTGRPAFPGQDRQELLRQIAGEEPRPPRRLHKAIPAELETIVQKAMAKDPAERYGSAQELGDDLDRFLEDRPIQARPPTLLQRLRKWARRNPALIRSAAAGLLLAAAAIGWAVRDRAAREGERRAREEALDQAVERTLNETGPLIDQGKWSEALAAVERADKLLTAAGRAERPKRMRELQKALAVARRLEDIYREPRSDRKAIVMTTSMQGADRTLQAPPGSAEEEFFWGQEQDRAFAETFREFGIDIEALSTAEAAARIREPSIRQALVQAVDEWAAMRKRARGDPDPFWKKLVAIARQADPDDWRNGFREALLRGDRRALETLADAVPIHKVPPPTAYLLGHVLKDLGAVDKAMAVLREAHRDHPDDFWLNDALGYISKDFCRPPRYDEALRYYSMTVALRPRSGHTHSAVAWLLEKKGTTDEAIAEYSKAIELSPNNAAAWNDRGLAYLELHQCEKALADFSKTIELAPKYALPWYNRGLAYLDLHQYDKALPDWNKAIELDPKNATAWNNRGLAYLELHQYDKALTDFSKAIELRPKLAVAWHNRGSTYNSLHQYDEALADLNKAIELDPKNTVSWNNRGFTYNRLHQYDKAVADLNKAIELDPKNAPDWTNRGFAYTKLHQYDKALADLNKAIELDPKLAAAWMTRGLTYSELHQYDKAVADFAKALELEPDNPDYQSHLAWLLATCPEAKLRDPKRAVELAATAAKARPKEATNWTTLGVARYRAGDGKGAVAALQEALKLLEGAADFNWRVGQTLFFLAMSHQQAGNGQGARQAYERALAWVETNHKALEGTAWQAAELRRFRAEAEQLLGIKKN
jgi:tetratricopeptide (TPR) repeat protein